MKIAVGRILIPILSPRRILSNVFATKSLWDVSKSLTHLFCRRERLETPACCFLVPASRVIHLFAASNTQHHRSLHFSDAEAKRI